MTKKCEEQSGFTLIELLVVMFIIGLSVSLLAPDMYSLFKRSQAKNEITKFRYLAQIGVEQSFFSESKFELTFEGNTATLSGPPDINTESRQQEGSNIIKRLRSELFSFEPTKATINGGKWEGPDSINLAASEIDNIVSITLLD